MSEAQRHGGDEIDGDDGKVIELRTVDAESGGGANRNDL